MMENYVIRYSLQNDSEIQTANVMAEDVNSAVNGFCDAFILKPHLISLTDPQGNVIILEGR